MKFSHHNQPTEEYVEDLQAQRTAEAGSTKGKVIAAGLAATLLVLAGERASILNIPHLDFLKGDGGKSDPEPKGEIIYETQTVVSTTTSYMIDLGNGNSVVAVQAHQNWDKPGTWLNGDFQSTNGTASVEDPKDSGSPAKMNVTTDYCAPLETDVYRDSKTNKIQKITARFGDVFMCDANLRMTQHNVANFKQDDTPQDFQAKFVGDVVALTEVTAKAAPCPKDELKVFTSTGYEEYARNKLAIQYGAAQSLVSVTTSKVGKTDPATARKLQAELKRRRKQVNVSYLGEEKAVDTSCFFDKGSEPIAAIDKLNIVPKG